MMNLPVTPELLLALFAVAVSWGQLNQRLKAMEAHASKIEAIGALNQRLVAMEAHAPKLETLGRFEERLDRLGQDVRDLAQAVREFMNKGQIRA